MFKLLCLCTCQLTQHESLVALFDNRTWCRQGAAEEFDYISHHHAWRHPQVNIFLTLFLFIIMKVGLYVCETVQASATRSDLSALVSVLDVCCGHHHARPVRRLHAGVFNR